MNHLIVSIIVPIYNVEQYLPKCIESAIAQTYKNIEILLVDDGSPDNCPTICDEYAAKDPRIKVIHKENGGLSSARNAGLEIFGGEYVFFLDSDDWIEPTTIEKMLAAIQTNHADLCLCRCCAENESGTILSTSEPWTDRFLFTRDEFLRELTLSALPKYTICCNKLYSREIIKQLRFPVGLIHEDEFFTPHVYAAIQTAICLNDVLYHYLVRSESITHEQFSVRRFDKITAWLDRIQLYNSINKTELAALTCERTADNYCAMIPKLHKLKHISDADWQKVRQQKNDLITAVRKQDKSSLNPKSRLKLFLFAFCYPLYSFIIKIKG